MFDKNKNIKVGRDINIQVVKQNLESLNNHELSQKKKEVHKVLEEESKEKKNRFKLSVLIDLFIGSDVFCVLYF